MPVRNSVKERGLEPVRELVGGWRTKTTWDMLDLAAAGNAGRAILELDRLLSAGEVLVLPAGQRCRAYRRPRDRREATAFVAAYPTGQSPDGH